jgi:very-short-patch-repair endonuclease
LCEDDHCKTCYEKSFSSHPKSKYWNNKNKKSPRQVFKYCNNKFAFTCEAGHHFNTSLNNVTNLNQWCPQCCNKTEQIVYEYLQTKYITQRQVKFDWCKNKRHLPFDIVVNRNIIIEIDGQQHFEQISNWKSHIETQKMDFYKMQAAIDNNYRIIRIVQKDIFNNKFDWRILLDNAILRDDKFIFICQNNEYKNYIELIV